MAPAATAASKPKTAAKAAKTVSADVDLVRSYLRDIGRVPLLTHESAALGLIGLTLGLGLGAAGLGFWCGRRLGN